MELNFNHATPNFICLKMEHKKKNKQNVSLIYIVQQQIYSISKKFWITRPATELKIFTDINIMEIGLNKTGVVGRYA